MNQNNELQQLVLSAQVVVLRYLLATKAVPERALSMELSITTCNERVIGTLSFPPQPLLGENHMITPILAEIVQGVANQTKVFCILEKTGISNFLLLRGFSKLEKFQNTNMKIDNLFEQ